MAVLTAQNIVRTGLEATMAAAAAGGDSFANTGKEFIYITNGGGGDVTVTLDIETTVDGQAVTDPTVVVTAGESRFIGPFGKDYEDSNNRVSITYSGVASVTIAILRLP